MKKYEDALAETSILAAFVQGLLTAPLEPELFTLENRVAATVFAQKGQPSSPAEASLMLGAAGLKSINPSEWFGIVSPNNLDVVLDGLRDLAVNRRVLQAATAIQALVRDGNPELRAAARQKLEWAFEVQGGKEVSKTEKAHRDLDGLIKGEGEDTGYRLAAYPLLSNLIGPLDPYLLWVLAAKPGVGKSALSACMALDLAMQGARVLYCSPDMGAKKTLTRIVATHAGVVFRKVWWHTKERPTLSSQEQEAMHQARFEVEAMPLFMEDTSNVVALCGQARQVRPDLLIGDYLGLFGDPSRPGYGTICQEQATASASAFRNLAGVCCVGVLSHTRIGMEADAEAVSWSAELGRKADTVLWGEEHDDSRVLIKAPKNRNGPTGQVPFYFHKPLLRYIELKQQTKGVVVPR